MTHEILITEFGGQGVLSMGRFLAQVGLMEGKEVSWLPSYGPEMRGGSAFCSVILSGEPIGSPVVTEPTCLMALSTPSLARFVPSVQPGGLILVNSSLVDIPVRRQDVCTLYIPCSELAAQLGNTRVGNTIMMGAFLELTGALSHTAAAKAMEEVFHDKPGLCKINLSAYEKGREWALSSACVTAMRQMLLDKSR